MSEITQNVGYSNPTLFQLCINRLAHTVFYAQSVNVPGFSIQPTEIPTHSAPAMFPGIKLRHSPLNVTFLIDEDYQSWLEIFYWMGGLGATPSTEEYKNQALSPKFPFGQTQRVTSDATLIVHSVKYNPKLEITFRNLFPVSLSDIDLAASAPDASTLVGTASFEFDYAEIKRIG